MNKLNIIGILLIILSTSCVKDKHRKHFQSGMLEALYHIEKSDTIKIEYFYNEAGFKLFKEVKGFEDYDSIKYFYKNGNLFKKGIVNKDGLKKGNWYRYRKDGYLSDIREYFIIKNKSIINRKFYFNKDGDTVWSAKENNKYDQKEFINDTLKLSSRASDMTIFKFQSKDTITLNEPFAAYASHFTPLLRKYNSESIVLIAKDEFNFNEDFSNERDVKLDTFKNLKYDKTNQLVFKDQGHEANYTVVFGRWFKTPGEKIIRGYMKEYFERGATEEDDNVKGEYRVYFEKRIYVKDTLE